MFNNYLLAYLKSKPFQSLIVNVTKAIGTFVLIKIIAIYGGASSLASFSNFQNIIALMLIAITISSQTGLTASAAGSHSNKAAIFSMILISILLSPLAIVLFYFLSEKLMLTGDLLTRTDYIFYLGFLVIPFSINSMLVAWEVGLQRYSYIFINYILIGLSPFIFLITSNQNFFLTEILLFYGIGNWFGVLFLFWKMKISLINVLKQKLKFETLRPVISYGLMSGVIGLLTTICALVTRQYISINQGVEIAGQWDALIKIGLLFQFIVITPLSSTTFPILVKALGNKELNIYLIIANKIKILFIVCILAIIVSFIFSDWIVWIILSNEFLSISLFLPLILLMESLKGVGVMFGLIPLALRNVSVLIINHLIFTMTIVIGLVFLSNNSILNLSNIAWLYFIASSFFLVYIVIWVFFWKKKSLSGIYENENR